MYLGLLNEAQKAAFLALATQLVRADGKVVEEEFSLMGAVQAELGWHVSPPRRALEGQVDLSMFETRQARVVCFLGLHILAICDDQFALEEIRLFDEINKTFGFTAKERGLMLSWARDVAPLALRGWQMVMSGEVKEP